MQWWNCYSLEKDDESVANSNAFLFPGPVFQYAQLGYSSDRGHRRRLMWKAMEPRHLRPLPYCCRTSSISRLCCYSSNVCYRRSVTSPITSGRSLAWQALFFRRQNAVKVLLKINRGSLVGIAFVQYPLTNMWRRAWVISLWEITLLILSDWETFCNS